MKSISWSDFRVTKLMRYRTSRKSEQQKQSRNFPQSHKQRFSRDRWMPKHVIMLIKSWKAKFTCSYSTTSHKRSSNDIEKSTPKLFFNIIWCSKECKRWVEITSDLFSYERLSLWCMTHNWGCMHLLSWLFGTEKHNRDRCTEARCLVQMTITQTGWWEEVFKHLLTIWAKDAIKSWWWKMQRFIMYRNCKIEL